MLEAKWIWSKQKNYNIYNQTTVARKTFQVSNLKKALMRITADSHYRLYINNEWINDGPCRGWPEHYYYDELNVTSFLIPGNNEIRIVSKYWGVGTFHQVPRQAGLLVQLQLERANGQVETVITDESWLVADGTPWLRNTPKVSPQMEAQEYYDACLEDSLKFSKAAVLYDADSGPWKDLRTRDVALLTKKPFTFAAFIEANVVEKSNDLNLCVPTVRLTNPGVIEANHNIGHASGLATVLCIDEPIELSIISEGYRIEIDGKGAVNGSYKLNPGKHLLLALVLKVVEHVKEKNIRIENPPESLLCMNPLNPDYENPWCWIEFPEFAFAMDDINWQQWGIREDGYDYVQSYLDKIETIFENVSDLRSFKTELSARIKQLPVEQMFVKDTYWRFLHRKVIGKGEEFVASPENLIHDNADMTVIHPCPDGDIELIYDLGEQNCGYYSIDLISEAGVKIDIYGVEYISETGNIQHTKENKNGMRYITLEGLNRYISFKRRSGRFLYITFRGVRSSIEIRNIQLIESTYPVNQIGSFRCSDSSLDKIWEISARTLKLCMEDTFTDCPLYEQTLWVGDARNEAMFAYPVYKAVDISKRCITLAAQSLEKYPIVGCQVPSAWECLLPAWSFLWGISVWDFYFYTGDVPFLNEMWPSVVKNIKGAKALSNKAGLFSTPMWNMFDWSGIDDGHETVTHNSMLLVGAIDAALKMASVLKVKDADTWLNGMRDKLIGAINDLWDDDISAYPDSIHADGKLSPSISQHTSFLSMLYDIVEPSNKAATVRNVLSPVEKMVKIGSPFAMMYFYETLEKIKEEDQILQSIYESYLPMLEEGATTVWEVFPSSNFRPGDFPARSHCHAWSSAPVYFLNRIILGIKQVLPGGKAYIISPRLNELQWAKGSVATIKGTLNVAWKRAENQLNVKINAPEGIDIDFVPNETHHGLKVNVNYSKSH